jgi:hypothetical protein
MRKTVSVTFVVAIGVLLWASVSAQPALPVDDVKVLKGTWVGDQVTDRSGNSIRPTRVTIVVKEDGTWEGHGSVRVDGTVHVERGKAVWRFVGHNRDVHLARR